MLIYVHSMYLGIYWYRVSENIGREINLVVEALTAKLSSANIQHLAIFAGKVGPTAKLNSANTLNARFGAKPPSLMPANITTYTVCTCICVRYEFHIDFMGICIHVVS